MLDHSEPSQLLDVELQHSTSSITFTKPIQQSSTLTLLNPVHWKPLISRRLDRSHTAVITIYTIFVAFSAYFTIYGIKSSLFAATFDGATVFGNLDLKVAFSISQTVSYGVSKIAGAIVIPTIKRQHRCLVLILLAILSEIPLVFFGCLPPIGQVIMVFLSGIPMAWMWGIMVMYLEGRKTSDFLLMGLYLSVMVASGAAKSIAASVMKAGVSEQWMPGVCGAFAALFFIFFIYLLDAVPDPNVEDKKLRSERRTMSQAEARKFLLKWAPGFLMITLVYSLLGAYRNFRDYFAPELWRDLEGPDFDPARFTQSELPVGICTAVAYSLLYWIKDNRKAFFSILAVMFLGGALVLFATITQTSGLIEPLPWMIMVGVGLFMAYIPPGAMLYDRFNGAIGQPFTSVFMIYLSDVSGYAATLAILLYRNFGDANISWVKFFHSLSFISSIACMAGMLVAGIYFWLAMGTKSAVPSLEEGKGEVMNGEYTIAEEAEGKEDDKEENKTHMEMEVLEHANSTEANTADEK